MLAVTADVQDFHMDATITLLKDDGGFGIDELDNSTTATTC